MATLVRRLDVDIDEVLAGQQFPQRGVTLAPEIRMDVARGAFHLDHVQTGADTQPHDQVDRRDDAAAEPVFLGE